MPPLNTKTRSLLDTIYTLRDKIRFPKILRYSEDYNYPDFDDNDIPNLKTVKVLLKQ